LNGKPYFYEINQILTSVEITSLNTLEFMGKPYSVENDSEGDFSHHQLKSDERIVLLLRDLLYHVFHCRQPYSLERKTVSTFQSSESQDLSEALSSANVGQGTWEPGWEIKKIERDGKLLALHKNGLTLWVSPLQFSSVDGTNDVGKKGFVRMTKEYRNLLPGFYMAIGNTPAKDNEVTTVRLYWNIKSSHATLLMKFLTGELNILSIPFHLKILNNPHFYPRADAAVLYIKRNYLPRSRDILSLTYQNIRDYLNPTTPLFAKTLCHGISIAEDPIPNSRNESFGQNRSRILAEAIFGAYKNGLKTINERFSEITRHFQNLKLDFERPYLNPLSSDNYGDLINGVAD
jgi:hypothetical protein